MTRYLHHNNISSLKNYFVLDLFWLYLRDYDMNNLKYTLPEEPSTKHREVKKLYDFMQCLFLLQYTKSQD